MEHYTPSSEELKIGFECEIYDNGRWKHLTIRSVFDFQYVHRMLNSIDMKGSLVRVKYLDEEDVLSLGFILLDTYDDIGAITFEKDEYKLSCYFPTHPIDDNNVYIINEGGNTVNNEFLGKIKNKSELQQILKML